MEPLEILKLLTDAPLALLLMWLLISERKEHANTRLKLMEVQQAWADKYLMMSERVVSAVERLDLPGPPRTIRSTSPRSDLLK